MGNILSPCFTSGAPPGTARLVRWGGETRILHVSATPVADLLVEFPDHLLCRGSAFYIGYPVPALTFDDRLLPGETYFLVPAGMLQCNVLTVAVVSGLLKGRKVGGSFGGVGFFERVRTAEGREVMRVSVELMERVLGGSGGAAVPAAEGGDGSGLCSTRELRKQYEELVGWRVRRPWSPRLETISERKCKCQWGWSPTRRREGV